MEWEGIEGEGREVPDLASVPVSVSALSLFLALSNKHRLSIH